MNDTDNRSLAGGAPEFPGAMLPVAGWHAVRLGPAELAALRKTPGPVPTGPLPAGVQAPALKHSDEQTVAAFAALCGAMASAELAGARYEHWGIVAASRFIGRGAVVGTIDKFNNEGPWGVSMQLTPHHMTHGISSTLSLALSCHGICIGAGGGPGDEASALLAALGLLRRPGSGGLWLLFTGWEPEMLIDRTGRPTVETHCVAAALAVLPSQASTAAARSHGSLLRIQRRSEATASAEPLALTRHIGDLLRSGGDALSLRADLGGGLEVELELRPTAPEGARVPARSDAALHTAESQPATPHFVARPAPLTNEALDPRRRASR